MFYEEDDVDDDVEVEGFIFFWGALPGRFSDAEEEEEDSLLTYTELLFYGTIGAA